MISFFHLMFLAAKHVLSAEDTDEVEAVAEAEAGDRAGTVQDHGLGLVLAPHLGRYHALLNALAYALLRIQDLPGEEAGQGTEL
ncbi:unnamed protein product [Thlaspi arvense]|uniref:Uncharacterized protein n=1 Tax=Thlaspi arvense TaxID=13288 RepID=A0AAU9SYM1_THLAR|nr:unnamed protein product [Thlaspi arvense]